MGFFDKAGKFLGSMVGSGVTTMAKDVAEVVEIVDRAGINKKVARLEPLICVKG